MGLDVLVKTASNKKDCELSRQFGRELMQDKEMDNSILSQVFKLFSVDFSQIEKMNVWDLERHFLAISPKINETEKENRYEKAWQSSKQVLENLKALKIKIELDPKKMKEIDFRNEYQRNYYKKFREVEVEKQIPSFLDDLKLLIEFLESLSEDEKVKFYFF